MRRPQALKKPEMLFAGCRTANLPLYFVGPEADSVALYEQLFAHCKGIYFRYLDEFGDPVVYPAPPQSLHQVGFEREDCAVSQRPPGVRGFRPAARILRVSAQVSRLQSDPPRRGAAAAQGKDRRHRVRVRRGQCAARRGGAALDVRSLCGAGGQSVREDHGPHPAQVEPARISCHPGSQSLSRLRAASPAWRSTPIIRAAARRCRCRRSMRPRSTRRRHSSGPYLHDPPAAAAAHCRGKAPGRVLRLYRHRYVHLA